MYKRVILLPYKMGSSSGRALKGALLAEGVRCFRKRQEDAFVTRNNDLIIYLGGTNYIPNLRGRILNANRSLAQNKLNAFRALEGLSVVPWTTDKNVAAEWDTCVIRHNLTGHSGQGIEIVEKGQPIPNAPLYTKYVKKTYECRIHVFNGSVIDAQIKKRRADVEETNNLVRNIHTGWVYCREGFEAPEVGKQLAIQACAALNLDFGAVDLIYNQHYNQFYILEVNTAPGLEGTTLANYVKAIKNV